MSRFWQIFCATHLLAFGLLGGELTFRNVHVRTRTLTDAERFHGYTAHQFELENLSTISRKVTIQLPWENYHSKANITDLRRTVTLGPESRKVISLYQPPLSIDSFDPIARFTVDGETKQLNDAFGTHVSGRSNMGLSQPATVLASRSWSGGYLSGSSTPEITVHIAEGLIPQWPRHWLAYSGFDGVVLRAKEWNAAPAEVRQALGQFVRAGGQLIVAGTIPLPPDARKLSASQLASRAEAARALSETVNTLGTHEYENYSKEEWAEEEPGGHEMGEDHPSPVRRAASSTVFALGWGLINMLDSSTNENDIEPNILMVLKNLPSNENARAPALASVMAGARALALAGRSAGRAGVQ